MSDLLQNIAIDLSENPYVTLDSQSNGVSRVYDDMWDFNAQNENVKKVMFTSIPQEHRANVQRYTLALLRHFQENDPADHVAVNRVKGWVDSLGRLIKSWGKSDFSLLSKDSEWREAKVGLKGRYSPSTLKIMATTINKLAKAGLASRHVRNKEICALASDHQEKQHIAFPPTIHAQILEKVVNTVDTYYTFRHDISQVMQQAIEISESYRCDEMKRLGVTEFDKKSEKAFDARLRIKLKHIPHNIPDFKFNFKGAWINSIIKDCLIAVGLFSGARYFELLSMNPDSFYVISGVPVLQGFTSKGNEGVPIPTTWVSHPIAEKALELAYEVAQYARSYHKSRLDSALSKGLISDDKYQVSLKELTTAFITIGRYRGEEIQESYLMNISNGLNLDSFCISSTDDEVREFDLLNPDWEGGLQVGGTLPKFSLHDLRRSFAVFMVRNKLGNLQTIKYQYKHKNINMSGWYANYAELARMEGLLMDGELFDMVQDATQELAVDAFDEIYNQSETLTGGAGERIKREKEDALQRGERVVMSREEITGLVRRNSLSIVILPTGGYCTNADCERLCSIESFVAENKPCNHEVITVKGAKTSAKQRERLITSFRNIINLGDYAYSRILAGYKEKILVIENTLKKHKIDFEPFTDTIEVLA